MATNVWSGRAGRTGWSFGGSDAHSGVRAVGLRQVLLLAGRTGTCRRQVWPQLLAMVLVVGAAAASAQSLTPVTRYHLADNTNVVSHREVDVTGDGRPDVLVRRLTSRSFIEAYDGPTGNLLWSFSEFTPPSVYADCNDFPYWDGMAAGDVNDDGVPDAVFPVHCTRDGQNHNRLIAFNGRTGAVLWLSAGLAAATGNQPQLDLFEGASKLVTLTIARLSPAETPSILFGAGAQDFGNCALYVGAIAPAGRGNYCRWVMAVDGATGQVRTRMFATASGNGPGGFGEDRRANNEYPAPAVFDLDGDGSSEIVYGGAVFSRTGTVRWERPGKVTATGLANLDGDAATVEVLMLNVVNSSTTSIEAFSAAGTSLWSFALPSTNYYNGFTVADLEKDGRPDILFTYFDYGLNADRLLALDANGQQKWIRSFAPVLSSSTLGDRNRPAIYGLDGVGANEVIVQHRTGIEVLDGTSGLTVGSFTLPNIGEVWAHHPTVADLNGDGHAEIVVGRANGTGPGGIWVLQGTLNDWRPIAVPVNQPAFHAASIDAAGHVPFAGGGVFAAAYSNVFATPVLEAFTPPPPTGPPGAPLNVVATASGNNLSLSWDPPATGAAPTSYTLLARTVSGQLLASLPLGTATTFGTAAPNGVFVLSVRAANAFGTGPESPGRTVTFPAAIVPPGTPSGLVASVTGNSVSFSWNAPASGGAVGNYLLVAGLSAGFSTPIASVPLPVSPRTVSFGGLSPGTYYVRMLAQNAGGTGGASNEVGFTIAAPAAPGAPTLNPPQVSGSTVSLSWSPGGGGVPTSYVLVASTSPGGPAIVTVPLSGTSAAFAGVPSGTYYLKLIAVNGVGSSAPSNQVTLLVP